MEKLYQAGSLTLGERWSVTQSTYKGPRSVETAHQIPEKSSGSKFCARLRSMLCI